MRIAVIADEDRFLQDQASINRCIIGLVGAGHQISRITPEDDRDYSNEPSEARLSLVTRFRAPMHVLPWSRRDRVRRLVEAFGRTAPEVLLATGEAAWTLALDLGHALDAPVAIDLWSASQVRHLPAGRRSQIIGGFVAPTQPIARLLRERIDEELVCCLPPGVEVPSEPFPILNDPERSIAIAIIGGVRDVPAYRALLTGLSGVVREFPQIQIFLELRGPHEQEIWGYCRRLDLLANVSTMKHASQQGGLLTRCDLMLIPERYGELHSLMLEAMARGVPVVASADPMLDMLENEVTALVVDEPEPELWARSIRRLVTGPDAARELGLGGRARMQLGHLQIESTRRLLTVIERLVHGSAVPIDTTPRTKEPR